MRCEDPTSFHRPRRAAEAPVKTSLSADCRRADIESVGERRRVLDPSTERHALTGGGPSRTLRSIS